MEFSFLELYINYKSQIQLNGCSPWRLNTTTWTTSHSARRNDSWSCCSSGWRPSSTRRVS